MIDPLEHNKHTVLAFYDLMFNQSQPARAVEQYVGDVFIQHTPGIPDGKAGFITYFTRLAQEYPGKHVAFKRVIAEGQYVVVHCHLAWPEGSDWASIGIFRLDAGGKIVEQWEVLQPVPQHAANANTMF